MRAVLVVALALWMPACGLYSTTQRRSQTFSLITRPAGARVWMQDGSFKRDLGDGPVTVTGEYDVEVTRFNRWWWLATALSAGTTGAGGWMVSEDGPEYLVLGIVTMCYGVLGLIYSLANNITGEMEHGKERFLPAQLELDVSADGHDSRKIRIDLPVKDEPVLVGLDQAWYVRYGMRSGSDLKDPGALPALITALSDEDARVRVKAVRALGGLVEGNGHVAKSLRWVAASDPDSRVKNAAVVALRKFETARLVDEIRSPELVMPPQRQPPAIVAVLDIQDSAGRLGVETRRQLSRYLAAAVSRVSNFRVIPPRQLRQRLSAEKKNSFSNCRDDACRIELGKALSAQKVLATDLLRMGDCCVLTASLYELKTETIEKSALVETGCSDEALVDGVKEITGQLGG